MSLTRVPLLRIALLVALVLWASVPAGMMRAPGPQGSRLVLCTPDGMREVWLAADGSPQPVQATAAGFTHAPQDGPAGPVGPDGSPHGKDRAHCLQVGVPLPLLPQPRAQVPRTLVHDLGRALPRVAQDSPASGAPRARHPRAPPPARPPSMA